MWISPLVLELHLAPYGDDCGMILDASMTKRESVESFYRTGDCQQQSFARQQTWFDSSTKKRLSRLYHIF